MLSFIIRMHFAKFVMCITSWTILGDWRNICGRITSTVSKEAVAKPKKEVRFIATVRPVSSEQRRRTFVSRLKPGIGMRRTMFTHTISVRTISCKSSAMTANRQDSRAAVLEAIKKAGVQDVAVVVTRYFGGTLLGASGLVRAYGKSAALGIDAAGIVRKLLCVETRVTTDYSQLGRLQAAIASEGYSVKDTIYTDTVTIDV